jgi:four helix bundle protein
MVKSHKDLQVWKEAVELSVICHDITRKFPREEQFGLTSQMRRAAISTASNIAEGAARASSKEFIQFLYISLGSASELDTQIEIAQRVGLGEPSELKRLQLQANMVSRLLQGLIRSVKRKKAGD